MSQLDRVRDANSMYQITSKSGERTWAEIAKVAELGAKAAKDARADSAFTDAVLETSRLRETYASELEGILGMADESRAHFGEFLEEERAVLLTAGLEQGLIEEALAERDEVAEYAREWRGDSNSVFRQVEQLQISAEQLSRQLTEVQAIENALQLAHKHSNILVRSLDQTLLGFQAAAGGPDTRGELSRALVAEIATARQTNSDLADRLTHTAQAANIGPHETRRRPVRVDWNLTFGVVGFVMCVANVTIVPVLNPAFAAMSGMYGGILTDRATNKLMDRRFGDR